MSTSPYSPRRRWTVLVYFSAENNLAEDAVRNLNEMLHVGSTHEVQLLAFCDLPGIGGKTYVFRPLDENGEPRAPIIRKVRGNVDSGHPDLMSQILEWAFTDYDAENKCVILWGHSSGWDEFDECRLDDREDEVGFNLTAAAQILASGRDSFLFRGTSIEVEDLIDAGLLRQVDFLNNFELSLVFQSIRTDNTTGEGEKPAGGAKEKSAQSAQDSPVQTKGSLWARLGIDILGFDSCLMGMGEVAGQLAGNGGYVVASESEIPNLSWPYTTIFEDLLQNPEMTPQEFASVLVNSYVDSIANQEELKDFPATLSVLDLDKYKDFEGAMNGLRKQLEDNLHHELIDFAIHKAHRLSQSFFAESYVDIYDFCQRLSRLLARWRLIFQEVSDKSRGVKRQTKKLRDDIKPIIDACKNVMKSIDGDGADGGRGFVFYERHAETAQGSHGVSIYFPSISHCYPQLAFAKATGWPHFLRQYTSKAFSPSGKPCPCEKDGVLDAKPDTQQPERGSGGEGVRNGTTK